MGLGVRRPQQNRRHGGTVPFLKPWQMFKHVSTSKRHFMFPRFLRFPETYCGMRFFCDPVYCCFLGHFFDVKLSYNFSPLTSHMFGASLEPEIEAADMKQQFQLRARQCVLSIYALSFYRSSHSSVDRVDDGGEGGGRVRNISATLLLPGGRGRLSPRGLLKKMATPRGGGVQPACWKPASSQPRICSRPL